jgi:hypothetical protein
MTAEQPEQQRPYHITVKLMIWAKEEEEAREIAIQMMNGEEFIPPGSWFIQ